MDCVELGGSGLKISRLTLGCEPLGGTDWGCCDVAGIIRAIHVALDAGVNSFDVADVYSLGLAEERLAEALGERRKEAVIVTKFGVAWQADPSGGRARTYKDASPQRVVTALEGSLRRLKIDCIPVYLIHWPDPATPIEDTIDALERCMADGKIRCYGLSNFGMESVAHAVGHGTISVIENEYSLLERRAEPLFALGAARGMGVLAYGTLASGFLAGKYSSGSRFSSDDRRRRLAHFAEEGWQRSRDLLERLRTIADRYGRSCAEIAIGWVMGNPSVTSAIVGAKASDQVTSSINAVAHVLTEDDRQFLSAFTPGSA